MNTTLEVLFAPRPLGVDPEPALEAGRLTSGGSVGGIDPEAMERFRKLARRGAHPGASSGERVANRLAKALHAIGDDLALLDPEAIEGACGLVRCMSGPWPTDRLKEVIFNTVRSAAGK